MATSTDVTDLTGLTELKDSLWQDCEARYQAHSSVFLSLQDQHGLNVNLLLLATELNTLGLSLNQAQWHSLSLEVQSWDEHLIIPFRRLRRLAKPSLTRDEYQQMLQVELMMERKVQQLISARLPLLQLAPGQHNLAALMAASGLDANISASLLAEFHALPGADAADPNSGADAYAD